MKESYSEKRSQISGANVDGKSGTLRFLQIHPTFILTVETSQLIFIFLPSAFNSIYMFSFLASTFSLVTG